MLGSFHFSRVESERQSLSIRRSIYSVSDKKRGDVLNADDVKIIRPGLGLHPRYLRRIFGITLAKDISYGDPLTPSHFSESLLNDSIKHSDFRLEEVVANSNHEPILFDQLKKRRFGISHESLPTYEEHEYFVRNHPYRGWWLILAQEPVKEILGTVYVSKENAVGLHINLTKVSFTASYFTEKLQSVIQPLTAKHSEIRRGFYYNVAPSNQAFIEWLENSGYYESQRSFCPLE